MIYIAIITICIALQNIMLLNVVFNLSKKFYLRIDDIDRETQQMKVRLTAARKAHKFQEKLLMKIIMLNLRRK